MRNVQDKIKSVEEVTLAEVRDILKKREKEYAEMALAADGI